MSSPMPARTCCVPHNMTVLVKASGKRAAQGERTARRTLRSTRGAAVALAALACAATALILRDARRSGWYEERHYSALSLPELQRERGNRLDDPILLYYTGLRLNERRRYAEADPILRAAVGLDPDASRLRDAWAESLLRSGRITAAFGELKEYAARRPTLPQAHLLLGKFYVTQQSMGHAADELRQAVALDPSLAEAWAYLADANSALGLPANAEHAAERAAALRPSNAKDQLGLGVLQLSLGQAQRARQTFGRAAALAPRDEAVHREYARCLMVCGGMANLAEAEAEARSAIALAPTDAAASFVLGEILLAQGRLHEAAPALGRAALASPIDPVSALDLSRVYSRLGNVRAARYWYAAYRTREARGARKQELIAQTQNAPHDSAAQVELAFLLAEEGDVPGCLRHEAGALRCAPDAPPALADAAKLLTRAGRPAPARLLAQRAIDVAPNNPEAREAMGNTLLALGRTKDAAVSYAQAARGFPDRIKLYQSWLDQYVAARLHGGRMPEPLRHP